MPYLETSLTRGQVRLWATFLLVPSMAVNAPSLPPVAPQCIRKRLPQPTAVSQNSLQGLTRCLQLLLLSTMVHWRRRALKSKEEGLLVQIQTQKAVCAGALVAACPDLSLGRRSLDRCRKTEIRITRTSTTTMTTKFKIRIGQIKTSLNNLSWLMSWLDETARARMIGRSLSEALNARLFPYTKVNLSPCLARYLLNSLPFLRRAPLFRPTRIPRFHG